MILPGMVNLQYAAMFVKMNGVWSFAGFAPDEDYLAKFEGAIRSDVGLSNVREGETIRVEDYRIFRLY